MLLARVALLCCLCAIVTAQIGGFDFISFLFGHNFPPLRPPGLASCGSYNRSTSICCNGTVAPRTPRDDDGVDHNGCCGSRAYDRRNGTCCGRDRLSIAFGERHGACCGDEPYDSRSGMCCNGAPAPLHGDRGTGCCSPGVSYSFEDSICCRGVVAPSYGPWYTRCCGNSSYDALVRSCCGGVVKDSC